MNNHGLEYERIGQLRSIAMQRIAEGSGIRKTKWRDKQWAGPIPEPKEQGRHDE